jgi:CHAT domain-containing protein
MLETSRSFDADSLRRVDLHNLQLAVFSTCSTKQDSDRTSGMGVFAEALERSGVPHVVASRWAVDSVETRRSMEIFYQALLSGHTVSSSIQSTAQVMLSNSQTQHPYFWAAFAAYGQP